MKNKVIRIGGVSNAKTQSRSVYDTKGVSPTLMAGMYHSNTVPYVVVNNEKTCNVRQSSNKQL